MRTPYVKRAPFTPGTKGRYGFLPKDGKASAFAKKPEERRAQWTVARRDVVTSKPWEKSETKTFRPNSISHTSKFAKPKPPKTAHAAYAPKQETTSWGSVATWYDKHLENPDTYHEKVILPNLLRLVEPQKGDVILDLATGQGFIARALAEAGARVTGLDISTELIALAKKRGGANIAYKVGGAEDLSEFTEGQFNKAVIVLAIQNIEHVRAVFSETARVLKKDGTLHVVMNHPAFRIPKRSGWGYDEKEKVQFRRVDQYVSESREEIDMHPGMKDSPQTISFHRPLQYYVKALVKAGFVIDRFEEWISHKDSDSGPRAQAENRARKEIPLFLYMRAKKT
ncbi:MAG: methyltransferase domain-containing protein [bacterium]|nr:methyltransferase domain-containing protein [bacterium]